MSTESAARKAAERIMFGEMSAALIDFSKYPLTPDQKSKLDQITRIIESSYAAACQTVAPPPEVHGPVACRNMSCDGSCRLMSILTYGDSEVMLSIPTRERCIEFAAEYKLNADKVISCARFGAPPAVSTPPDMAYVRQALEDVRDHFQCYCKNPDDGPCAVCESVHSLEILTSGVAVSTPRCPVCSSERLSLAFSFQELRVTCANNHTTGVNLASDMTKFFKPAPSPPQLPDCCKHPFRSTACGNCGAPDKYGNNLPDFRDSLPKSGAH